MKDENGEQLHCPTGKAIYSQKEAYNRLHFLKTWRKGKKAKKCIRVYRCDVCHEWHLTSAKKTK